MLRGTKRQLDSSFKAYMYIQDYISLFLWRYGYSYLLLKYLLIIIHLVHRARSPGNEIGVIYMISNYIIHTNVFVDKVLFTVSVAWYDLFQIPDTQRHNNNSSLEPVPLFKCFPWKRCVPCSSNTTEGSIILERLKI